MPAPSPLFLSIALLLSATAASAAAVSLDGLVTNSPFVLKQSEEVAAPVATEGAAVEFRGIISTQDGLLFGLYDRAKNLGAWVKEGEKGSDFSVSAYDANNDMVTVEYAGQRLTLPLSSAQIGAASASPLPVVNPRQGGPTNVSARADDRRRLESVAAEVRRRRALRQSAAAAPGQHQAR